MNTNKLLYLLPVLFFISCKKKDDPTPATDVAKQWYYVKANNDDTVNVENGYLYMSTEYPYDSPHSTTSLLSRNTLKGDFELRIKYSSVGMSATNPGALFFGLIEEDNPMSIMNAHLSNDIVYTHDSTSTRPDIKSTTAREGEWYVKRTGGNYKVWMRAGADTSFIEKENYSTGNLTIGISIASSNTAVARTTVHIDDISIEGGGGDLVSDPFDKNSIEELVYF